MSIGNMTNIENSFLNIAAATIQHRDVSLADLAPHPRNYNRHSDAQIARIARSLTRFGQVRSIVTWRNTTLAGHGVVAAARSLGWPSLRADVLPDAYPEQDALAYVVADNELARLSDPDQEQLAAILEELNSYEPALVEAAGYGQQELEQLLRLVGKGTPVQDAEPQVDRAEELRQKWGVKTGDLWGLGKYTVCPKCGKRHDLK